MARSRLEVDECDSAKSTCVDRSRIHSDRPLALGLKSGELTARTLEQTGGTRHRYAMNSGAHAHAVHSRATLADAVRDLLEAKGERWTQTRADVFDVISHAERPYSAYDVAERATAKLGRRVPANSVYRILDLFAAHDVVKRVESRNAYVVNEHPGCPHDCIFLLCDRCDAIDHIDDDPTLRRVRRAAESGGFRPSRPVVEVHGLCSRCAEAADAEH